VITEAPAAAFKPRVKPNNSKVLSIVFLTGSSASPVSDSQEKGRRKQEPFPPLFYLKDLPYLETFASILALFLSDTKSNHGTTAACIMASKE
jgi:hypothetical protein